MSLKSVEIVKMPRPKVHSISQLWSWWIKVRQASPPVRSIVLLAFKRRNSSGYATYCCIDTFSSCVLVVKSEVFVVNFTSYDDRVTWNVAKSRCEDLGQRLAVVDTAYKLTALREQVWVKNVNVYCNNETLFNNKYLCQNIFNMFEFVSVL